MAYTSAPEKQTYSSERITLIHSLDVLPGRTNFDTLVAGMTNVLPFQDPLSKDKRETYGETRNAIVAGPVSGSGSQLCRGAYVWEKTAGTVYYFTVITDGATSRVYSSTDSITWAAVTTLPTNGTTPVRFTEFIDSVNTKKLILVDGISGFVFTSNLAGTQIVDADFPTPHVPFPIVLDGFLFLAKSGTGDIYNSDLNAPDVWTPGSFISSELYPDDIQALVKVNNYLLAIGKEGSEFFYDAANPTASPLARYEGGSLPFGTVFPNSIASSKDVVILLANNNDGEGVFKIIEGFKHTEFPADVILKVFSVKLAAGQVSATGVRAAFFRQSGELFYLFNFNGTSTSVSTTDSVVANISTRQWVRFVYNSQYTYPVFFTAGATSGNLYNYVAGHYAGTPFFGTMSPATDAETLDRGLTSVTISQTLVLPPVDFGTLNLKTMSRVGLSCLRVFDVIGTVPTLAWTDNNTLTYSTPRPFAGVASGVSNGDIGFPFLTQLGAFRSRGLKLSVSGYRTRWNFVEVDINKGMQ